MPLSIFCQDLVQKMSVAKDIVNKCNVFMTAAYKEFSTIQATELTVFSNNLKKAIYNYTISNEVPIRNLSKKLFNKDKFYTEKEINQIFLSSFWISRKNYLENLSGQECNLNLTCIKARAALVKKFMFSFFRAIFYRELRFYMQERYTTYYNSFENNGCQYQQDSFVYTWGLNTDGRLGNNSTINKLSPAQSRTLNFDWLEVSGVSNLAIIRQDNSLWISGNNTYGNIGDNTTSSKSSPVQTIAGGTNWQKISFSSTHSSSIKNDGTLWLWGDNTYGQLGINSTESKSSPIQTIAYGNDWVSLSSGDGVTGCIKSDGSLWMWGNNSYGNLGDDSNSNKSSPVQTISTETNWSKIACGKYHTAAIKNDGTLWLWGDNTKGQLGDETITPKSSPVQTISGGDNWSKVATGMEYTVALKTDGSLWSWGNNLNGTLGDNTTINKSSPVQTTIQGKNWLDISAYNHTVALKTTGSLWLWGSGVNGSLGNNSTENKLSPAQTTLGGFEWKKAVAGDSCTFTIIGAIPSEQPFPSPVLDVGPVGSSLWAWGLNDYGQLGNQSITVQSSPIQTVSTKNWKSIYTGKKHTVAIKADGTLWAWGSNSYGELGIDSIEHKSSPVQTIAGGNNWKQSSCGLNHTAAIKYDGTLWLWGSNDNGQLGDDTNIAKSSPVQTVSGGNDWKQVTCGIGITAGIKNNGTLWLWGDGRLGDDSNIKKSSPVQTIAGGNNWKYVNSSGLCHHVMALKNDGTLWTWGDNTEGELGTNDTVSYSSPVQTIAEGYNWLNVSCGYKFSSAIKNDGTLWLWGNNYYGYLGDNTIISKSSPIQTISAGTNWKDISASTHVMALKKDNELWMWGSGEDYCLSSSQNISSPVQTLSSGKYWSKLSTGENYTMAIYGDPNAGYLYTWGQNRQLQLGIEYGDPVKSSIERSSPVQTTAGGFRWAYLGEGHSSTGCIKNNGTLFIWGGYGGSFPPNQLITSGNNWEKFSHGSGHFAGIKTDGSLWLYGNNHFGQLGTNNTINGLSLAQTVSGGTDWQDVYCGKEVTAAIKKDGTLWVWGRNILGRLGTNNEQNYSSPVQTIAGGNNWKQIGIGPEHAVAVKHDGSLWTWGGNFFGELGTNSNTNYSSPIQTVVGGNNWNLVSCGVHHTAATKYDGTLWLWGSNPYGQLGDDTFFAKSSPVQTIAGGSSWIKVSCGNYHTGALKSDGTMWLWGDNEFGQLGDNTTINKSSPVQTVTNGIWANISCGYYSTTGIILP